MSADPFAGLDLPQAIAARAEASGIELSADGLAAVADHARAVLRSNDRLKLTAIVDPPLFLERHVGESFEGAALIPPGTAGNLVDLGSGNGYPGIPLAVARPLLEPYVVESSSRKAAFLRELVNDVLRRGAVLERQVQRPADLEELGPIAVLATRAMGGWERVLPRLVSCLAPGGAILLWAGETVETVRRRTVWGKLELAEQRPLPGRDRSWVWRFTKR